MADLDAAELARLLVSKRKRTEKVCPVCGVRFVGRSDQIYHHPNCRARALRQRVKDAREAQEPKPDA